MCEECVLTVGDLRKLIADFDEGALEETPIYLLRDSDGKIKGCRVLEDAD